MNKKIIKEFLKPSFVTISLFVIICFLAVIVGSNFLEYITWLNSEIRTITFYPGLNSFFWFPFLKLIQKLTQKPLFEIFSRGEVKEMILPLLVNIAYWYFLSYLIVFVYDKFKGRK